MQEFKPALLFLGKFLLIYLICNVLYGIYVESFGEEPDDITKWATQQAADLLNTFGYEATIRINQERPTVFIEQNSRTVISVFEGCNGINVMIVFIAFVFAFSGPTKKIIWFIPIGIAILHMVNLFRIMLLYYTALHQQKYFYYLHKYFFTAILYLVVFALWAIWVKSNVRYRKQASQ